MWENQPPEKQNKKLETRLRSRGGQPPPKKRRRREEEEVGREIGAFNLGYMLSSSRH